MKMTHVAPSESALKMLTSAKELGSDQKCRRSRALKCDTETQQINLDNTD